MEYLNHIQKNSDILLKLINQRLDLGRLESGNIKGVKSTVDLEFFFESNSAIVLARPLFKRKLTALQNSLSRLL